MRQKRHDNRDKNLINDHGSPIINNNGRDFRGRREINPYFRQISVQRDLYDERKETTSRMHCFTDFLVISFQPD